MKRFVQVAGMLLLVWILSGPVTHFLCLPGAVHASWVEPLATTGSSYSYGHDPELFTGSLDTHRFDEELEPVFRANEQKRKLYAVFKAGTGKMGLSRRYSTVEGKPVRAWVLVEDGKLVYVKDCSRDGGASPSAVYTRTPLSFRLGFMREGKFVEGDPAPGNSAVILFKIEVHNVLENRLINNEYFY